MKLIVLIISLFSVSHAQTTGDVKFYFIGTSATDFRMLTAGPQFSTIKNTNYYNPTRRTALYFHGAQEKFASTSPIVNAYVQRGEHNIIYVDYSTMIGPFNNATRVGYYLKAVQNLPKTTIFIANILNEMRCLGLDLTKVHIIGYSLGAQLAGMVGSNFRTTKNFSFCRITGLDPAGPLFLNDSTTVTDGSIIMPELGQSDAKFVDVIHTSMGGLGTSGSWGHAGFYVNGGRSQPGCGLLNCFVEGWPECIDCSHTRALKFYCESVTRKYTGLPFDAKLCPAGATNFTKENCVGPKSLSMGYYASNWGGSIGLCSARSGYEAYFVETNSQPNYSKS